MSEAPQPRQRVRVLMPLPVAGPYDYLASPDAALAPGDFVEVPLGKRMERGVVWTGAPDPALSARKLKTVARRLDAPPLAPDMVDFVDWVAGYTAFPPGAVLRLVMRSGAMLDPPAGRIAYAANGAVPQRLTPARAAALDVARRLNGPASARRIAKAAGVSEGVVRGLVEAGALYGVSVDPDSPFERPDPKRAGAALSREQAAAAAALVEAVRTGEYSSTLIDGVTGSGKTEVYLEAAAAALAADPEAQVLVLIPEIALTLPFVQRVGERFGAAPARWHSDVGAAERRRVWRRVADGSARLVVGARSALFLPFRKLRLVIVDEEHDGAYKQDDGVLYQGRDMAVARAARGGFPVILASATPSLETVANAEAGRYRRVALPARYGAAQLPEAAAIDLRATPPEPGQWLAPPLVSAVNGTLARGEQALLFLNRRGYAPLTICRKCGERMTAPGSDTWLVEHRYENKLVCHHTGFSMPKPKACPKCGTEGSLAACGPGVERVAEEARARWPEARVEIFSSDTVERAGGPKAILDAMCANEIDILVATQAAAKGHNFPNLTLVGVVDADMGLSGGDLRAGERTFQVLSQVSGRAGRAQKPGRVLLQTYQPHHAVIRALLTGDRDAFLAAEAAGREALGFPPFGRLAALLIAGEAEEKVRAAAMGLAQNAPRADGVEVWGPAPAPLYKLRGRTRMRFLIKARRDVNIQAFMRDWLAAVKTPASVRRIVDIDPYNFL